MEIIKGEKRLAKKLDKSKLAYAKMPLFFKGLDGEWLFTGQTTKIYTIEEFEEYKKMYAEIYDLIKQNYAASIANVYKVALNSFVSYEGQKGKTSELFDLMMRGKSVSLGKVFGKANSVNDRDAIASMKHILNGTNQIVNGRTGQPFRPFRLSGKGMEYIFPEFSGKGVVAQVEGKNVSVKFRSVSQDDADRLRDYMLSCVPGTTKEEVMLQQIVEEYFAISKHAADLVKGGAPEDVYKAFSELNLMSAYLFDTDLSAYETAKPQEGFDEDYIPDGSDLGGDDDFEQVVTIDEEPVSLPETDPKTQTVAGFDMLAKYVTEPVVKDGAVVIRISPTDGAFVVTFNAETQTYTVENEKQKGE